MIDMLVGFLGELAIPGVEVFVNSLGGPDTRTRYREALVQHLTPRSAELSAESQRRLATNPLRILDSKDPGDIRINADAPDFHNFHTIPSKNFFADVRKGLGDLGIEYRVNPHLVRGLDYYSHTVFEFVTTDLGAQGTVLAGGRYDGLVELMGGPAMPGVGWAAGIERLAMLIGEPPKPSRPIALVPIGEQAEATALPLAEELRNAGLVVEVGYSGNLQRRMRRADRISARAAVIFGTDELAAGTLTLRDFDSGEQTAVSRKDLAARLKALQ
jgi:histidyl-tRNA synthetase